MRPAVRESLVREGRVCRVVRVLRRDEEPVFEKRYRVAWPWLPLLGLLKANVPALDARAEAANLERARALGIEVPRVISTSARWRPGLLSLVHESTVTMAEAPGEPLETCIRGLEPPERRRVARHVGAIVRALHEASIFHRDLYLCHFLRDPVTERLTLIDLARAGRRRTFRTRFRVKDLAAIFLSSRGLVTHGDTAAFLRAYFRSARIPQEARALARKVVRKAASLLARGAKG